MKKRIGLIGKPSDWLVASSPDPKILTLKWGPEIIHIGLPDIIKRIEAHSGDKVLDLAESLGSQAQSILEPSSHDLEMASKVYLVLKQVIREHRLDALTIRCFDLVVELQTTGCFALALLNEEGLIAGCEGDLPSTLSMLWVYEVLGLIPWMANPAQIDIDSNSLVLAHCTVPRSIVRQHALRSHFESGLGVGIQGEFAAGPVTLLRIGGAKFDQIWIVEGAINHSGSDENLCRTQVEISLDPAFPVKTLLEHPLGNHLVMVAGHHQKHLQECYPAHLS